MQGWRQILSWQEELPILWEGKKFWGIRDFDCRVIRLRTYKEEPGDDPTHTNYMTVLPISLLEDRRGPGNISRARVRVQDRGAYTAFIIYDDWNTPHVMQIPSYMTDVIQHGIQAAKDQELLVEGEQWRK